MKRLKSPILKPYKTVRFKIPGKYEDEITVTCTSQACPYDNYGGGGGGSRNAEQVVAFDSLSRNESTGIEARPLISQTYLDSNGQKR